jgi:hypothetical protein
VADAFKPHPSPLPPSLQVHHGADGQSADALSRVRGAGYIPRSGSKERLVG